MIPWQIWNIPEGFATVLGAAATLLAGSFVLIGAIIAWKSVQRQIHSAEGIEKARQNKEISAIEAGFTAEMLVYSRGVIEAASIWNQRAKEAPKEPVRTAWPVLQDPLFYSANISRIGILPQPWVMGGIISFYTNVLELNDQARETMAGRPTVNATSESVAARLRLMAANLSQVLDGLNADKKFPLQPEIQREKLFMPNGLTLSEATVIPKTLQDVLLRLAGMTAPASV